MALCRYRCMLILCRNACVSNYLRLEGGPEIEACRVCIAQSEKKERGSGTVLEQVNKLPITVSTVSLGGWSPSPELAHPARHCLPLVSTRPPTRCALRHCRTSRRRETSFPITRRSLCIAWTSLLTYFLNVHPFSRPSSTPKKALDLAHLPTSLSFGSSNTPYRTLVDFGILSQLVAFFLPPSIASHYKHRPILKLIDLLGTRRNSMPADEEAGISAWLLRNLTWKSSCANGARMPSTKLSTSQPYS